MTLQLGDIAPDFETRTTEGLIRFHEWLGDSWGVLFSHPRDFTPVCTTELSVVASLKPEFEKRNVKVIGLSVDPLHRHRRWADDIRDVGGVALNFPIIGDDHQTVAQRYGMIHPAHDELYTVRTVFVIGPDKKIKLTLTYPQTTGRNFNEILRVIESLQLTQAHSVSTPANWQKGEDVIILPSISDEVAKEKFKAGWVEIKPYLRLTPDPTVHDARAS